MWIDLPFMTIVNCRKNNKGYAFVICDHWFFMISYSIIKYWGVKKEAHIKTPTNGKNLIYMCLVIIVMQLNAT